MKEYTHTTNIPVKTLEGLKREDRRYSIEFFVQEAEMGGDGGITGHSGVGIFYEGSIIPKKSLPEGFISKRVGKTRNPNYDSQRASFYEGVKEVDSQLQAKYEGLFEADLKVLRKQLEQWEKTPMSEWERRNQENQEVCPYCNGTEEVPTGRYRTISAGFTWQQADGGPEMELCGSCHDGKVDATTLREYHKPAEPDRSSLRYLRTDPERNKEIKEHGLKLPLEHFDVYVKITPKE